MERRELLLEEQDEVRTPDPAKLRKLADEGGKYLTLVNSPGWKDLMDTFITPRLALDRYLTAPKEELAEIRAAQRELSLLVQYVQKKVDAGMKAYNLLKESK